MISRRGDDFCPPQKQSFIKDCEISVTSQRHFRGIPISGAQPLPPPHPHPSNPPSPSLTDCAPSAKSPPQHRSFIRQDRPLQMADSGGSCSSPKTPSRKKSATSHPHLPCLGRATPPRSSDEAAGGTRILLRRPAGQRTLKLSPTSKRHRRDLPPLHPVSQGLPRTVPAGGTSNLCGYRLPQAPP